MMKRTGNALIDDSQAEWVVGSDECGLGSWAGPLVVCAAALPRMWRGEGAVDSKTVTPRKRRQLFTLWTMSTPVLHHVVSVSSERVDELGVQKALLEAHREALEAVLAKVQGTPLIVVDGFPHGTSEIGVPNAIGLPKGDSLVPAVGVASIIGKVTHDEQMLQYAKQYKGYGFDNHQGYGTKQHREALERLGPCPIHRRSYAPIAKFLNNPPGGS